MTDIGPSVIAYLIGRPRYGRFWKIISFDGSYDLSVSFKQNMMAPYGTPPPPFVMYPHGGVYVHPSVSPVTLQNNTYVKQRWKLEFISFLKLTASSVKLLFQAAHPFSPYAVPSPGGNPEGFVSFHYIFIFLILKRILINKRKLYFFSRMLHLKQRVGPLKVRREAIWSDQMGVLGIWIRQPGKMPERLESHPGHPPMGFFPKGHFEISVYITIFSIFRFC